MPKLGEKGRLRTALEDGTLAELQDVLRERCDVDASDPNTCWVWTGNRNGQYPYIRGHRGLNEYAHRAIWRKAHARIPEGMQIHHRCAKTLCIRIEHLQLVSGSENRAEMLARRALENRILDLEEALQATAPGHPMLSAGLDRAVNLMAGTTWTDPAARMERLRTARTMHASHRAMRARQVAEVQARRDSGMTATTACAMVGIHKSTYYKWRDLFEQSGIPTVRELSGRAKRYASQKNHTI